jgi:hypothetical protein
MGHDLRLTTEFVQSEADVLAILAIGDESRATASIGLGRIVALHHRSSTSYQIHLHIWCLFF